MLSGPPESTVLNAIMWDAFMARIKEDPENAEKLEITAFRLGIHDPSSGWRNYCLHLLACVKRYAPNINAANTLEETLAVVEQLVSDDPSMMALTRAVGAYAACIQGNLITASMRMLEAALLLSEHQIDPDLQREVEFNLRMVSRTLASNP